MLVKEVTLEELREEIQRIRSDKGSWTLAIESIVDDQPRVDVICYGVGHPRRFRVLVTMERVQEIIEAIFDNLSADSSSG